MTDHSEDIDTTYLGETAPRNSAVAIVLTLCHPALGYLYVGQLRAAVISAIAFFAGLVAFLVSWGLLKFFPFWPLLTFFIAWEVMSLMCLVGVLRQIDALENSGTDYLLRVFNNPFAYILVMLLLTVLPLLGAYHVATQLLWGIVQVNDNSMYPALSAGDVLLVDRVAYLRSSPVRGDMVVLSVEDEGSQSRKVRLGRVLGLPSDEVRFDGQEVLVNGERLMRIIYSDDPNTQTMFIERNAGQSYLIAGSSTLLPANVEKTPVKVSSDRLLVIGDNRAAAIQKRQFWTVPSHQVLGKPRFLLYANGDAGVTFARSGLKVR